MSINKIFALLGALMATFNSGAFAVIMILASFGILFLGEFSFASDPSFALVIVCFSLLIFAHIFLAWFSFTKLDKEGERTWKICLLVLGLFSIISTFMFAFSVSRTVSILEGISFILAFALKPKNADSKVKKNAIEKECRAAGLDKSEIKLFCQTMDEAEKRIERWAKIRTSHRKELSGVEKKTLGLKSAKKTFQFILQNPKELTRQGDFLYKDLPNMVKLVESYAELSAVSTQDDEADDELLRLIEILSDQIADNYQELLLRNLKVVESEILDD